MFAVIVALVAVPFAAAIASLIAPPRAGAAITVTSGVASFGLVLALVPAAAHRTLGYGSYVRVDAVSVIFMLATGFLYAAVAVYCAGYVRKETEGEEPAAARRYTRRFYALFNLFGWSMLVAPTMNSLALLWIAVEVTTVVSALLVALENTDAAVEAAWKYVLIASAGLGLGLLATIFAYFAGAQVLGQHYDLALNTVLQVGARLPHTPVRLAFMLAVLGYGTKVGLFPVHTWLPDAHSEAPTPVSALLSGSLLAVSFYAILRYFQIATATLGSAFPRDVLLAFGVASLLLASLYLLDQRDLKRLLAYSSVEHMGILAIGVSFGAPVALAGVMLHVLAHAAAKGNAFMGAGVFTIKFGSKQISAHRGAMDLLPWSGPMFLLAVFALSAMPPFGIFRSEFQIVAGGFSSHSYAAAAVLVVLVTVAFFGLTASATSMLLSSPRSATVRGEPSAWMVVPVVAGIAVLLVLGLHPPSELTGLISRAVAQLGGAA
ncbi:MAG: proton-conducting transporter membrane subunit [Streptosporangiaceae bacterium]|jgi:hydrogenase-4 component F